MLDLSEVQKIYGCGRQEVMWQLENESFSGFGKNEMVVVKKSFMKLKGF